MLLFGADTGQTGVYSLQQWTQEAADGTGGGLPHNTVLAFESRADAEHYAQLLERQMGCRAQVGLPGPHPFHRMLLSANSLVSCHLLALRRHECCRWWW